MTDNRPLKKGFLKVKNETRKKRRLCSALAEPNGGPPKQALKTSKVHGPKIGRSNKNEPEQAL
jgi:hypothetical protein